MFIFYFVVIFTIGFVVAFQPGLNAELAKLIDSNLWAAIISFFVGLVVLLVYALVTQQPVSLKKLIIVPPYVFIGGALGALFVLSIVIVFPKIGAVNAVIFTVAGQMLCSTVIDHYGWFNAPLSAINWQKTAALLLMLAAIFWFQKARV
ncbi:MAG: hypothetical protein CR975_03330 [Gammaproteobacteria bacterium]|nr:MAG: hypothetical protein CR975_03330 [Gammaproteobacteria bacterium]